MDSRYIADAALKMKRNLGKSYARMAREIGVSPGTFKDYRSGRVLPPVWRKGRIREVLGLEPERDLFQRGPTLSFVGAARISRPVDSVSFSRDDRRMVVSDIGGSIYTFDLGGGGLGAQNWIKRPRTFSDLQIVEDGGLWALTISEKEGLYLWDVGKCRRILRIQGYTALWALSPSGNYVSSMSERGVLYVFQKVLRRSRNSEEVKVTFKEMSKAEVRFKDDLWLVRDLVFSPSEEVLAFVGPQNEVIMYRWPSVDGVHVLQADMTEIDSSLKFSPEDDLLAVSEAQTDEASGKEVYRIRLLDVDSGGLIRETNAASPAAFVYRRGGKYLVRLSAQIILEIENARTGESICSCDLKHYNFSSPGMVKTLDVSPSGNLMAVSCARKAPAFQNVGGAWNMLVLGMDWD